MLVCTLRAIVLMCLLPLLGHAVPKVGKLDNTEGPRLVPVATPGLSAMGSGEDLGAAKGGVQAETLTDNGVATFFEKNGDWRGAATQWQRVAYDARGDARTRALMKAGENLRKAGDDATAGRLYGIVQAEAGGLRGEVLYAMTGLALDKGLELEVVRWLQEVLATQPDSRWAQAGLYRIAWQDAKKGPVKATFNQEKIGQLQAQVRAMDAQMQQRERTAGWLSAALPGLGHAWLGEPRTAAAVLPMWALLMVFFVWKLRQRQWVSAAPWGVLALIIWAGSSTAAGAAARVQNGQLRPEIMATWAELQPETEEMLRAPVTGQAVDTSGTVSTTMALPAAAK